MPVARGKRRRERRKDGAPDETSENHVKRASRGLPVFRECLAFQTSVSNQRTRSYAKDHPTAVTTPVDSR